MILGFGPDPVEEVTPDVFRMQVTNPGGFAIGELAVIRKVSGWSFTRTLDAIDDVYIWWDRSGQSLKTPVRGTRLVMHRPVDELERDVLLAVCADITLGLRPYVTSMN